jgi:hypothetical protein
MLTCSTAVVEAVKQAGATTLLLPEHPGALFFFFKKRIDPQYIEDLSRLV